MGANSTTNAQNDSRIPSPRERARERGQQEEILRPSAEILDANSTTNAQNDMGINNETNNVILNLFQDLVPTQYLKFKKAQKLDSRTQGFENDVVCHSERSEESQSRTHRNNCPLTLTPTPSPNWREEKKPAFTLAEVLVTLGVIGIVAAMTLPMLAKNYQFFIRQQQFKKAYATLSIAVQKTQIDMGEGVRCNYMEKADGSFSNYTITDCNFFYDELVKNLQLVKSCKGKSREKYCLPKDGWRGGEIVHSEVMGGNDKQAAIDHFNNNCRGFSSIMLDEFGYTYVVSPNYILFPFDWGNRRIQFPIFAVDVNGHKNPNKWGHDIFIFVFAKRNNLDSVFKLQPFRGCHPLEVGGYYTVDFFNYLYGQNAEL